ncbi:hypothetical protein AZE42_09987 [Rhizopogon vesiculosus]|uniref:Uncharacterized protein n=1 Tax=Rhizopogon vesiculosus TaxID=180088 RepID=A0A1J8QW63_9AGAM|nr:hypothetical protein AZE42_09987 [Rhizopogon vesiculosus]
MPFDASHRKPGKDLAIELIFLFNLFSLASKSCCLLHVRTLESQPTGGGTICGKCLENHEQFGAQIFLLCMVLMPGEGIFGEAACRGERMHIAHLATLEGNYKEREWPYEESDMSLQEDEQSKKQVENAIQDSDAKIKTKKNEIAEHETIPEKEEKIFKGIPDSLKGGRFRAVESCLKRKRWEMKVRKFGRYSYLLAKLIHLVHSRS